MKFFSCGVILCAVSACAHATTPIVIAHRGASGYLPEHTLASKALAHGMGADFLEQDLVLSRDNVPIVLHDIHLEGVTDVTSRFPGRQREDGRWYALDFTVAELKQLRVTERLNPQTRQAVYPGRFAPGKGSFQIVTLEEELEFIAGLNRSSGRVAGIYPELKRPAWHRQQGRDLSRTVLPILQRHGYRTKADACWLQCFEYDEVKRLRGELGWQGRLVMLLGGGSRAEDGTNFEFLRSPTGLDELAKIVDGIGPALGSVIGADGRITALTKDAQARKLAVHPYTVRADDLPAPLATVDALHHLLFVEAGVDGVFTDFPDRTLAFVRAMGPRP